VHGAVYLYSCHGVNMLRRSATLAYYRVENGSWIGLNWKVPSPHAHPIQVGHWAWDT
jgi:hypothetical protein